MNVLFFRIEISVSIDICKFLNVAFNCKERLFFVAILLLFTYYPCIYLLFFLFLTYIFLSSVWCIVSLVSVHVRVLLIVHVRVCVNVLLIVHVPVLVHVVVSAYNIVLVFV